MTIDTEPLHEKEARERILEKLGRSGEGPWAVVGVVIMVVVGVLIVLMLTQILGPIALVLLFAIMGVYIGSIVWAYGDAEARGKSGCLVALLVFLLTWPVGLIIWVIFRPPLDGGEA